MELVIDVGNSYTKLGYFSDGDLIKSDRIANGSDQWNIYDLNAITSCLVSATTDLPLKVRELCDSIQNVIYLGEDTPLPFVNLYKTPSTLGRDRIAAIAGIKHLYPGKNALVIDAGTSITYDLIDENGRYYGGRISPGLTMRYKALNHYTGRLPEVAHGEINTYFGDSTESSIRTGVFLGLIEEINGTIQTFANKHPDLIVALSGGDADHLVNHVKYRIFALPNLILLGLHQILKYNAN